MSADAPSLDDLRREIDELDTLLHDTIMRRASLMERVVAAKRTGQAPPTTMRPGR